MTDRTCKAIQAAAANWSESAVHAARDERFALECLAWLAALPPLTRSLSELAWWSLVNRLVACASRPARADVAMTGELTLRGKVLPVGGLKEKLTAAARAGVRKVLVPARNQSDIVDVPDEVKQLIEIERVETLDDVLNAALLRPLPKPASPKRVSGTARPEIAR